MTRRNPTCQQNPQFVAVGFDWPHTFPMNQRLRSRRKWAPWWAQNATELHSLTKL